MRYAGPVTFARWSLVACVSVAAAACATGDDAPTARDDAGSPGGRDGAVDGGARTDAGPPGSDGGACATGTPCDGLCVDTATDPTNCGGCGRTCAIPNATAACSAGTCAVASCDTGFADCDATIDNGCELPSDCTAGGACSTRCGTTGTMSCADPCKPACMPPAETCNTVDDDCNGACDEGGIAGCRRGVHRSSGASGHFYTTDAAEAACCGYAVESLDYFFLYTADVGGLVPLFRCRKPSGNRFYTTAIDCEIDVAPESTLGFMAPDARCGATPLYRLYRGANDDHFYTTSAGERDNAVAMFGYAYESVTGHVWTAR
jgi:hypothetical protein